MIHAFALEPELVATWGKREEFRFIYDKFGIGMPRVMLELPAFTKWKKAVYTAALDLKLSQEDMKRIEEIFRLFTDHRCRRADSVYDGQEVWLVNAEREHNRKSFSGILARNNPRGHRAVLVAEQLDAKNKQWACEIGAFPKRTPEALSQVLSAMLINCNELHLIDPHFGPGLPRYRKVLEALMNVLVENGASPKLVRVHCDAKSDFSSFEQEAKKMASWFPVGLTVEFVRWEQNPGSEKLHNRYVLTDIGGVSLGTGLDAGQSGETDDVLLLPSAQYQKRWSQYAGEDGTFRCVDRPAKIVGKKAQPSSKPTRSR